MKCAPITVLVLGASLLTSGCSTLDDATKVESRFPAEAYTASVEFDGNFEVTRINGRPEDSRKPPKHMKLVPGTHEIAVIAADYRLKGTGVIPLTIANGQSLKLTTKRNGAALQVEVWDITDHRNDPVKLSSHDMAVQASALALYPNSPNSDTNGNRVLGR